MQSRRQVLTAGAALAATLSLPTHARIKNMTTTDVYKTESATRFLEVQGRKIAYRVTGTGQPIVLCHRFRGVLGLWDPAFIESLAKEGFQVITFDYSGIGLSSGERSYNPIAMLKDVKDLVEGLNLKDIIIAGWSIGGIVAQIYTAMFSHNVSHAVLLATTPPGRLTKEAEQLFYDAASKPGIDLDNFTTIFFEPTDKNSRAASERSFTRIMGQKIPRSPDVDAAWAISQIGTTPRNPVFPAEEVLNFLKTTTIPVLHIGADHDIIFPVENWYALNQQLPTLNLITYPKAGHGPHHQHPEMAASHISAFIKGTKKV